MNKLKERKDIPDSFRKNTRKPVTTVKELMEELKLLPEDLQLDFGFGEYGIRVYVPNLNNDKFIACFEEADEVDELDEEGM